MKECINCKKFTYQKDNNGDIAITYCTHRRNKSDAEGNTNINDCPLSKLELAEMRTIDLQLSQAKKYFDLSEKQIKQVRTILEVCYQTRNMNQEDMIEAIIYKTT